MRSVGHPVNVRQAAVVQQRGDREEPLSGSSAALERTSGRAEHGPHRKLR